MEKFDQEYWDTRYEQGATGWDIGQVSTPLRTYFDQLEDKEIQILIPGTGNGYEAAYLHGMGFSNVHILDVSKNAIERFKASNPGFPEVQMHHDDFFTHKGRYDLIVEQTFFCALDPKLRHDYVVQCHRLLYPEGKLIGLLWNGQMNETHPPFGGSKTVYLRLFEGYFHIDIMDLAYNSIPPRSKRELFIKLVRK